LDLRCLISELPRESLYLFLLLPDLCLQLLNIEVDHGLLGGFGNRLARGGLGRKSTLVDSIGDGDRAQPSIGIDEYERERRVINRCTKDVVDKAPVTYLAKNTVHTRQVADYDIVIHAGDTIPGGFTQKRVTTAVSDTIPGLVTHSHVVITGGARVERVITDDCVTAARHVVGEG